MKKKLEAELLSLAHRVLKLKGKEDLVKMHEEAKKLSELLGILRFYEERILGQELHPAPQEVAASLTQMLSEPTNETVLEPIHVSETVQESSDVVEEHIEITQEETEIQAETEEGISLEEEKGEDEVVTSLEAELTEENTIEEEVVEEEVVEEKTHEPQVIAEQPKAPSLEDFLKETYATPEFVKVEAQAETITGDLFQTEIPQTEEVVLEQASVAEVEETSDIEEVKVEEEHFTEVEEVVEVTLLSEEQETMEEEAPKVEEVKPEVSTPITPTPTQVTYTRTESTIQKTTTTVSLNDRLTKGLQIGLNDRIAFVKHLFNGSNEDYNRVLSQLNTFNSMDEAVSFIDQVVKPDYNDWADKEEYAQRFMALVERKFIA